MNKPLLSIAVAVACTLAIVGCSNKENQLVGTWKIDATKLPEIPSTGPSAAMAETLKKMMANISLELKADHTYTASAMGQSQQGTWKLDGYSVTMTPTGGKDNSPGTATLSDDMKTMTITPKGASQTITLLKQAT